jgi:hypothetical protein
MSIVITPGETALIEECREKNVEIQTENLLIGDIHIKKEILLFIYLNEKRIKYSKV